MEMDDSLWSGFFGGVIFTAICHGLLLIFIFLFSRKLNTNSNRYLVLALFGICVILLYELIFWLELEKEIPEWMLYSLPYVRTIIPVGIYFFVVFLINPKHIISGIEKLCFLAIGLELLLDLFHLPLHLTSEDTVQIEKVEYYIALGGWGISTITSLILFPVLFLRVRKYQNYLYNNYSNINGKSLKWLQNFIIGILVLTIFWLFSFFQFALGYMEQCDETFSIVTLGLVIFLFWVGYFVILRHHWFQIVPVKAETKNVHSASKLSSKTDQYYHELKQLVEVEKLYENSELTLDLLADNLNISAGYLSQIINQRVEKSFFEFINNYRVEAVKERLLNQEFEQYTIMGIATQCGFNSKSTFNSVFKKFTGHTPSAYKKNHLKK